MFRKCSHFSVQYWNEDKGIKSQIPTINNFLFKGFSLPTDLADYSHKAIDGVPWVGLGQVLQGEVLVNGVVLLDVVAQIETVWNAKDEDFSRRGSRTVLNPSPSDREQTWWPLSCQFPQTSGALFSTLFWVQNVSLTSLVGFEQRTSGVICQRSTTKTSITFDKALCSMVHNF